MNPHFDPIDGCVGARHPVWRLSIRRFVHPLRRHDSSPARAKV
jgi:hypothetical protein